jgi:hypothetical protein
MVAPLPPRSNRARVASPWSVLGTLRHLWDGPRGAAALYRLTFKALTAVAEVKPARRLGLSPPELLQELRFDVAAAEDHDHTLAGRKFVAVEQRGG